MRNDKSRSSIAGALMFLCFWSRGVLLQNPKICSQPFCNAEYKEKLSKAYHWILWSVLPLITKEDTIRVEHWDNLEDKVLSEAASDIVRRYKKVDQTLQNRQA